MIFQIRINDLIKTPCGRMKFVELSRKQGVFSRVRLVWFVVFATLRDLFLTNPDQSSESNS